MDNEFRLQKVIGGNQRSVPNSRNSSVLPRTGSNPKDRTGDGDLGIERIEE